MNKLPPNTSKGAPYRREGHVIMVRRVGQQIQFVNQPPSGTFPTNGWVDWMTVNDWETIASRWLPMDTPKGVSTKTDRLVIRHLKRRTP